MKTGNFEWTDERHIEVKWVEDPNGKFIIEDDGTINKDDHPDWSVKLFYVFLGMVAGLQLASLIRSL